MIELFAKQKKDAPKGHPFLTGVERYSWGELNRDIDRISAFFIARSSDPGDRILIATQQVSAFSALLLASLENGLSASIMDETNGDDFVHLACEIIAPKLVVGSDDFIQRHKVWLGAQGIDYLYIEEVQQSGGFLGRLRKKVQPKPGSYQAVLQSVDPTSQRVAEYDADRTALILFTSGSTSEPKAVDLTYASLHIQMQTFLKQYGYDTKSKLFNILPLHHTDGLMHGPLSIAVCGGTLYRPGPFSPARIGEYLDAVYRERITHFLTVPSVLALIDQMEDASRDSFQTPDFRYIRSSTALLDPGLWRRIEDKFGVMITDSYGMTEIVCEAIFNGPSKETRKIGTLGKPVDASLKVLDDNGEPCGVDEKGELYIKAPIIMRGYINAPEETAAVLQDGWFKTGDIVSIDGQGFVKYEGRKKAIIIRGGVNIFPDEVVTPLKQIPDVEDAACIGISDDVLGEKLIAFVVLKESRAQPAFRDLMSKMIARDKIPDEFRLIKALPRNQTGKLTRESLLDLLNAPTLCQNGMKAEAVTGVQSEILEIAERIFGTPADQLSPTLSMDDIDSWDSLAHVNLLTSVEERFGIKLPIKDIMKADSLGGLSAIVWKQINVG